MPRRLFDEISTNGSIDMDKLAEILSSSEVPDELKALLKAKYDSVEALDMTEFMCMADTSDLMRMQAAIRASVVSDLINFTDMFLDELVKEILEKLGSVPKHIQDALDKIAAGDDSVKKTDLVEHLLKLLKTEDIIEEIEHADYNKTDRVVTISMPLEDLIDMTGDLETNMREFLDNRIEKLEGANVIAIEVKTKHAGIKYFIENDDYFRRLRDEDGYTIYGKIVGGR
jgi:hypothetical protein